MSKPPETSERNSARYWRSGGRTAGAAVACLQGAELAPDHVHHLHAPRAQLGRFLRAGFDQHPVRQLSGREHHPQCCDRTGGGGHAWPADDGTRRSVHAAPLGPDGGDHRRGLLDFHSDRNSFRDPRLVGDASALGSGSRFDVRQRPSFRANLCRRPVRGWRRAGAGVAVVSISLPGAITRTRQSIAAHERLVLDRLCGVLPVDSTLGRPGARGRGPHPEARLGRGARDDHVHPLGGELGRAAVRHRRTHRAVAMAASGATGSGRERGARVDTHERLKSAHLYVVTPDRAPDDVVARAALRGGADMLQLRHKTLPRGELLALARKLRELTLAAGVPLIINDHVDIALISGADGAHLGADDLSVASARRLDPEGFLIGASASFADAATEAEEASADYIGCGPAFSTPVKKEKGVIGPAGVVA